MENVVRGPWPSLPEDVRRRPMYPGELLIDPAANQALDTEASAILAGAADLAATARDRQASWKSDRRAQDGRLVDELLAAYPNPDDLAALAKRFDSWGDVNVECKVRLPIVAAAYLRASGLSAGEALVRGLALIVNGTPQELVDQLAAPTADGARKRKVAGKPHWKTEPALAVHANAMYRHVDRWAEGETSDADTGAHPLAHAAWRALAVAWLETEGRRA